MAKKQTLHDFLTCQPAEQATKPQGSTDMIIEAESDAMFRESNEEHSDGDPSHLASGSYVLLSKPNQPRHKTFPSRLFGKQKRSFKVKWFNNELWSS